MGESEDSRRIEGLWLIYESFSIFISGYSYVQYHWWADTLTVSEGEDSSIWYRSIIEGVAIIIKIIKGEDVQASSKR